MTGGQGSFELAIIYKKGYLHIFYTFYWDLQQDRSSSFGLYRSRTLTKFDGCLVVDSTRAHFELATFLFTLSIEEIETYPSTSRT